MKRREFFTLLGGAAAWPFAARAQQGDRMRRIGVLMSLGENDPAGKPRLSAFTQALAELGWADGRNVRMDFRWGGADNKRIRMLAQELVGLQPDIILAGGAPATAALQRETRTIPIVFSAVSDPVASSLVVRLDRPSGNVTGFALYETTRQASGLSCSRRSRLGSSEPPSCSIPTRHPYRLLCPSLRRQPDHSRSSQSLHPFIAT
jgi:putative ABC transport system substrate-binding protein